MNHRLWKIDALRGVAIIGMVFFHANYMLVSLFSIDSLDFSQIFWFYLGKVVVTLFIILSGISLYLSSYGKSWWQIWKKSLRRAGIFGCLALGISLVTYGFFYEVRISWGIIHFFAICALLSPFFLIFGRYLILIWLIIMIFPYIWAPEWQSIFLIPIGYPPFGYFSADYYPIFPWFGVYLIGYSLAHILSRLGIFEKIFSLNTNRCNFLTYIGRHSLTIYIVHIPILYILFRML